MWFLFAVVTVLLWGGADLFYKIGSDPAERHSHWWIVVVVGLTMGLHAAGLMLFFGREFHPINLIRYLPASVCYILSMTLGYIGLRRIQLSVSSPIGNSSGAVAFLLGFIFLGDSLSSAEIAAVAVISAGIFLLSLFETQKSAEELKRGIPYPFWNPRNASQGRWVKGFFPGMNPGKNILNACRSKTKQGFAAIIFPILYCAIDGLGTFADAFILDRVMDEDQALIAYELTFMLTALAALFFLVVVKKEAFRPAGQLPRVAAGLLETAGQFFYVRALAAETVLAPPLIACYSIVSVLLSRLFLKERLTPWQYIIIAFIMAGIAVLGME